MRKYLNQLLTTLVQLRKCIWEFENRYSPQSCINEHEQAVKFYIEKPNPFVFDEQIKSIYADKMQELAQRVKHRKHDVKRILNGGMSNTLGIAHSSQL